MQVAADQWQGRVLDAEDELVQELDGEPGDDKAPKPSKHRRQVTPRTLPAERGGLGRGSLL